MVEELINSRSPDYDQLEKMSQEYFIELRRVTRPFSIFLFLMPLALIVIAVYFFENKIALFLSIALYAAFILASIYARYSAEKKYRDLDCSYLYFLVHSDSSLSTLRMTSLIMVVLFFIYLQTLHWQNEFQVYIVINALIIVFYLLSAFSPRFMRYEKISSSVTPSIVSRMAEIEQSLKIPEYVIHVVPEKHLKVANAYCAGIFKNRIFITDYLLDNLEEDEVVTILSHELGHVVYKHNLKGMLLTFSLLFLSAALFFSFTYIPDATLANQLSFAGIIMFLVGMPAIVPSVRRIYELQADTFASQFVDMETAISALKKTNYLNLIPAVLSGSATHPSLPNRIKNIQNIFDRRSILSRSRKLH